MGNGKNYGWKWPVHLRGGRGTLRTTKRGGGDNGDSLRSLPWLGASRRSRVSLTAVSICSRVGNRQLVNIMDLIRLRVCYQSLTDLFASCQVIIAWGRGLKVELHSMAVALVLVVPSHRVY